MVWKVLPDDPKPPVREGTGTKGRKIALRANFYELDVKSWNKQLVHYDVVIKVPDMGEMEICISKGKKIQIFESLKEQYPHFFKQYNLAYDGMKSAVSTGIIAHFKDGSQKYKVDITNSSGKRKQYEVSLKVVNKTNLTDVRKFLKEKKEFPSTVFQIHRRALGRLSSLHSPASICLCPPQFEIGVIVTHKSANNNNSVTIGTLCAILLLLSAYGNYVPSHPKCQILIHWTE
ncbi:hypothetical protein SK128_015095 [Halocaridina rubra]|uniref:Protein argonaute N-terminal domain-containing protein n=1 Tax=Halocaridina rubra TaxID=373956 RepID=A0AAN8WVF8_HALRR